MGRPTPTKTPAKRKREVSDMPAIRLKEARFFLGLGMSRWRVKWDEVYRYIVLHWETSRGIMINLESLVVAVYPDLKNDTLARVKIAHDFMWRVIEERQKAVELRRQKKRDAENDQSCYGNWNYSNITLVNCICPEPCL